jgi:hypothetical protein
MANFLFNVFSQVMHFMIIKIFVPSKKKKRKEMKDTSAYDGCSSFIWYFISAVSNLRILDPQRPQKKL